MWAAGNGGDEGDSCAADGYASSIYTIAIGAASSNGSQASYDEDCAGKMAVAFVTNSFDEENHCKYVSSCSNFWGCVLKSL